MDRCIICWDASKAAVTGAIALASSGNETRPFVVMLRKTQSNLRVFCRVGSQAVSSLAAFADGMPRTSLTQVYQFDQATLQLSCSRLVQTDVKDAQATRKATVCTTG